MEAVGSNYNVEVGKRPEVADVVGSCRLVEADIQLKGVKNDLYGTFVEQEEALPLLLLLPIQTCHLFYPSQFCAESAYRGKPSNKPCQPDSSTSEQHLQFPHFQQCKR